MHLACSENICCVEIAQIKIGNWTWHVFSSLSKVKVQNHKVDLYLALLYFSFTDDLKP